MELPNELFTILEEEVKGISGKDLQESAQALSSRYREKIGSKEPFMKSHLDRLSYALFRMPATMSALDAVCKAFTDKINEPIAKITDFGAAMGGSLWCLTKWFQDLKDIHFIERDKDSITLGKKLTLPLQEKINTQWSCGDIGDKNFHEGNLGLSLFSYSINELSEEKCSSMLPSIFAHSSYVMIIEPGTPVGYKRIIKARDILLRCGAHMIAPCPHSKPCPMTGGDWCHFSTRLPRTRLHQFLKGGSMGYEDEKFSYLIVSKKDYIPLGSRIIRPSEIHKAHIKFFLCTNEGLRDRIISRREGESYKIAKKLSWGDVINN